MRPACVEIRYSSDTRKGKRLAPVAGASRLPRVGGRRQTAGLERGSVQKIGSQERTSVAYVSNFNLERFRVSDQKQSTRKGTMKEKGQWGMKGMGSGSLQTMKEGRKSVLVGGTAAPSPPISYL